ncbi:hypothetical protein [Streptomyces sp. t39]|uniref:hypothetical protein n=1 Tax=Streptomyces sp. t39 TaxID=1828156 RepID=UPI0011CEB982|nr:hypothetical protein [Streptomyces sp. t39]TXS42887.1 hypothetical protein EAO77_35480 [Streptomyces sp. t39]
MTTGRPPGTSTRGTAHGAVPPAPPDPAPAPARPGRDADGGREESRAPRRRSGRRPAHLRLIAVLLAVAVAAAVACFTPGARSVLRDSFTQLPAAYTELYFTSPPALDRSTAVVPVSLVAHGDDGLTHRVRVSVEAPGGPVTASTTTTVTAPADGVRTAVVVRLPVADDGSVVRVELVGDDQTLHFRLGARGSPTPQGTP